MKVAQSCLTLCNPMDQSMGFLRPEYWSGQPFPSPGDLPNPGIKPRSPTLQVDSLPAEPQHKPLGSLMLLQMASFHSFLWLGNIPLYVCTTSSLSIPLLTFRLLPCPDCSKQCCNEQWCSCILSDHVFLWIQAQKVALQDHMEALFLVF